MNYSLLSHDELSQATTLFQLTHGLEIYTYYCTLSDILTGTADIFLASVVATREIVFATDAKYNDEILYLMYDPDRIFKFKLDTLRDMEVHHE